MVICIVIFAWKKYKKNFVAKNSEKAQFNSNNIVQDIDSFEMMDMRDYYNKYVS